MSISLKDAAKMIEVALEGVLMLQRVTKVGGDKAGDALQIVDAGLSSIADGFSGKTDPSVVQAELKALVDGIASDDTQADSDLDSKFK